MARSGSRKDRKWTEAGDLALRMYLEDEVSVADIAEDLKRTEDDVRQRIEHLRSEGKIPANLRAVDND